MKKIITLGFLFLSLMSFAQEIDIKRGKILIDEKPIALIDKEKRSIYTISTLEEEPKFMVAYKGMGLPNGEVKYWYEITSLATNKMNDIPFKKLTSSLGMKMNLAANLIKGDYPILTSEGIDEALLKKFTEGPSNGVFAGYKQKKQQLLKEEKATEAALKKIKANLEIDALGYIFFKNDTIGRIVHANKTINGIDYLRYVITDLDKIKVAEYRAEIDLDDFFGAVQSSEILTIDGKKIPYELERTMKRGIDEDPNVKNIVAILRFHGYKLGHQMSKVLLEQEKERVKAYKKAYKKAKKESANIYYKKGYVIDEDGKKWEGKIYAVFEAVQVGEPHHGMIDLADYGKEMKLIYINKRGKEKDERFKSKNGAKFCLETGECYLGLEVIGNTANVVGSISNLNFNFSKFYKILYDNEGYMLLVDPLYEDDYVIKVPSKEKGLFMNKANRGKIVENLNEYLTSKNISMDKYNFSSSDDLIKLLEDCKKNTEK